MKTRPEIVRSATSAPLKVTSDAMTFGRFQQLFPFPNLVRLFHTQKQLFDFIDSPPGDQQKTSQPDETCTDMWRPLSIELDSDSSVLDKLHASGQTMSALIDSGPSIFRRAAPPPPPPPVDGTLAPTVDAEPAASLHGTKPSAQTRYFVAVRPSFLYSLHIRLPNHQQHLYEILREGVPCHFYLDVEQEFEFLDSDAYRALSATLVGGGASVDEQKTGLYGSALFCRWSCPHRPEHSQTTDVLLRTLETYLETRKDLHGISLRDAEVLILRSVSLPSSSSVAESSRGNSKFSQHYIIRFHRAVFQDSRHVGVVVKEYVDWLHELSATDAEVHRALFFHSDPTAHPHLRRFMPPVHADVPACSIVERTDVGETAHYCSPPTNPDNVAVQSHTPLLPRRCIIDTAVYSRNRMFRLWGSTKLGKRMVLALDAFCLGKKDSDGHESCIATAPTEDAFMRSLISSAAGASLADDNSFVEHRAASVINLLEPREGACVALSPGVGTGHRRYSCVSVGAREVRPLPSPCPLIDAIVCDAASALPPHTAKLQKQARVTTYAATLGPDGSVTALCYPVAGTRYCPLIGREHKSNGIYFMALLSSRTVVLKCHDADCRYFRSTSEPPILLSAESVAPLMAPTVVHGGSGSCDASTQQRGDPYYIIDNSEAIRLYASLRSRAVLKRPRSD